MGENSTVLSNDSAVLYCIVLCVLQYNALLCSSVRTACIAARIEFYTVLIPPWIFGSCKSAAVRHCSHSRAVLLILMHSRAVLLTLMFCLLLPALSGVQDW